MPKKPRPTEATSKSNTIVNKLKSGQTPAAGLAEMMVGGLAMNAGTAEAGDHAPVLVVGPPEALTDEDCAAIRRWKWHLLMLMDFDGQPGLDAHLVCPDDARRTSAA